MSFELPQQAGRDGVVAATALRGREREREETNEGEFKLAGRFLEQMVKRRCGDHALGAVPPSHQRKGRARFSAHGWFTD